MPQFQILPAAPSFGSELGKQVGGGFGQGFSKGLSDQLSQYYQQKDRIEKGRPIVQSALDKVFKQFGANEAYSEDARRQAYQDAFDLFESGADPIASAFGAYDMLTNPSFKEYQAKHRASNGQEGSPDKKQSRVKELLSNPISKPFEESNAKLNEINQERLGQEQNSPLPAQQKPVEIMSFEELSKLPAEYVNSLPMAEQRKIGKAIAEKAKLTGALQFTKGIDPTGLVSRLEKSLASQGASPFPQDTDDFSGALAAARLPGELIKDLSLFRLASGAKGVLGKAGAAAGLFGGEKALRTGIEEGRAPSLAEVGGSALFGAAGELAAPVIGALWNAVKRIPNAFKAVQGASKAASVAPEEIIQRAASNLQKKGVDVLKAAEGDASALNALQKETSQVAKTFQESEKFNQQQLQKIRKEVSEKIPESPLEKYYAPKKEVKSRPETIAKEAERVKPLQAEAKLKERALKDLNFSILETRNALIESRAAKRPKEILDRLQSKINIETMQHQKTLNDIKNLEFEVKHGKPPLTSEEIGKQIEKQHAELREGIKNPTSEKLESIKSRIDKDKEALQLAERLAQRGEIPGPKVFDEYIKIHEQYSKGYDSLMKELKDYVRAYSGKPRMGKKVENAKELINVVENMQKSTKAKIANQIDKRRSMRILDRPSGAFYKQSLKDIRKDVDAFQKDFFKVKNLTHPEEAKVAHSAKQALSPLAKEASIELKSSKEIAKEAESVAKNPTAENIEKLSKESGLPVKETKEFISEIKKEAVELGKKADAGTISETDYRRFIRDALETYKKMPPAKRAIVGGLVVGTIQGVVEEVTGYKPPSGTISLAASIAGGVGNRGRIGAAAGAGTLAPVIYRYVRDAFESKSSKELKSLRNTQKFNERRKELEEKYGKTKANRILKRAIS